MELRIYPHLSAKAQKNLLHTQIKYGKPIPYRPSSLLVKNLSQKLGLSKSYIYNQLIKERAYLIRKNLGEHSST